MNNRKKVMRIVFFVALLLYASAFFEGCFHASPQAVAKQFVNAVNNKDAQQLADCMYWAEGENDPQKMEFVASMDERFSQEAEMKLRFVSFERGNPLSFAEAQRLAEHYRCNVRDANHVTVVVDRIVDGVMTQDTLELIAFKVSTAWYASADFEKE